MNQPQISDETVKAEMLDKAALLRKIREGHLRPDEAISALRNVVSTTSSPSNGAKQTILWEDGFFSDLVALVSDILHIPADQVDPDMPVADMGLDSLSATKFNNHVRAEWGLTLQATAFFECNTVRDFSQYILRLHKNALREHYQPVQAEVAQPQARSMGATDELETVKTKQESATGKAPRNSGDPARSNLQRLWEKAQQDLVSGKSMVRRQQIDRLLLERTGGPCIELGICGKGAPVLLLGGLLNPDEIWYRQLDTLKAHYRVIAFNKPGCGRSGVDIHNLSIDAIIEDLVYALDSINVSEPVSVVGFSFGGMLAQALAVKYPNRVRRLALINTTGAQRPRDEEIHILKKELESCPEVLSINGDIDFALAARYREVSHGFNMLDSLPHIKAPALVLSASNDHYMLAQHSDELAKLLARARHEVITNAGHFSLLTHWERVNTFLMSFLGEQTLPSITALEECEE
ncbi:hypothetical protein CS022_20335 [Veronia nyctiphanis]|uniref:Carrier domain-containing protein n=1 Tax=Veronia nyctiphanis TaxID=1278244 RepID=A0A4Q0YRG1_9GAMM|nr:alpha/beta fold hydrolase [Veronia nyctiphanis]RXJ71689.1 hypothetical protein CS022_20335 [Veronia nyctiphanis]